MLTKFQTIWIWFSEYTSIKTTQPEAQLILLQFQSKSIHIIGV